MSGDHKMQVFRAEDSVPLLQSGVMTIKPFTEKQKAGVEKLRAAGMGGRDDTRLLVKMPGFTLTEAWFKKDYPLALHSHDADCLYFIVAGSLQLGKETLGPRDCFFVPSGMPYTYTPGPDGVEVLEIRNTEAFDFRNHANGEAYYDRAAATAVANREEWARATRPSERKVAPSG